jgi:predicted DNA-binding protein
VSDTLLSETLFKAGALVDLNIGCWTAMYRQRPSELLMTAVVNESITKMHKALLPVEALEPIKKVESDARRALDCRSTPFPIFGAKFVANHALPSLEEHLAKLRTLYEIRRDELCAIYPDLMEKRLQELHSQTDRAAAEELKKTPDNAKTARWHELKDWIIAQDALNKSLYPAQDTLKNKFYFTWVIGKFAPIETPANAVMNTAIQNQVKDWVKDRMTQIHKDLGERAELAKAMLLKQGKLNPKNLKPLFDSLVEFEAMDFTNASQFHKLVDELKEKYFKSVGGNLDFSVSAEMLNSSETSMKELDAALTGLSALVKDEAAKAAGDAALAQAQDFKRFVDLS